MKHLYCILNWLLILSACTPVDEPSINTQHVILSNNRHLKNTPTQQVSFYNTCQQRITPDQFNQLLVDGTYTSEQRLAQDGSDEIHLVNIADYSATLEGKVLPDFELTDLNGQQYTNAYLQGKVTVLSFWCTNSQWCIGEMSRLDTLVQCYAHQKNIAWLALSLAPSLQLSHFLQKYSWAYTFIADQQSFAKELGIFTFPTHLIINQHGVIAKAIIRDSASPTTLKNAIERLL